MTSNNHQTVSSSAGDQPAVESTPRARYESPSLEVTKLRLITEGGTVSTGDSGDINTGFQ